MNAPPLRSRRPHAVSIAVPVDARGWVALLAAFTLAAAALLTR